MDGNKQYDKKFHEIDFQEDFIIIKDIGLRRVKPEDCIQEMEGMQRAIMQTENNLKGFEEYIEKKQYIDKILELKENINQMTDQLTKLKELTKPVLETTKEKLIQHVRAMKASSGYDRLKKKKDAQNELQALRLKIMAEAVMKDDVVIDDVAHPIAREISRIFEDI